MAKELSPISIPKALVDEIAAMRRRLLTVKDGRIREFNELHCNLARKCTELRSRANGLRN